MAGGRFVPDRQKPAVKGANGRAKTVTNPDYTM